MVRGIRPRATVLNPAVQPHAQYLYDPITRRAVKYTLALAGFGQFGAQFPYNNASTTDQTWAADANLTTRVNRWRDVTINSGKIVTCTVSPVFIFCDTFTNNGTLKANGLNGQGYFGGADQWAGVATGGGGGGGGGGGTGGAGGSSNFKTGGGAYHPAYSGEDTNQAVVLRSRISA